MATFPPFLAALCLVLVGFTAAPPAAYGQAKAVAATDDLLGFSRYLPADTSGYLSIMQMEQLRAKIAASQAWGRIEEVPEIGQLLTQVRTQLESKEIPPPVKTAIELLKSAGTSEVSFAVSPEASQDLLSLSRAILLSVAVIAPSPHAPDSLQGQVLETKRAPLRAEWTAVVPKVRLPSFAFAARVSDHAKYRAFVDLMVDIGWQAALGDITRGAPPPARAAISAAYSHVKVGEVPMIRFRLRLGEVVPPEQLSQGFDRLPLSPGEKDLVVRALSNLSVEAHLGFVGEYLTMTVGADDRFIGQIVERFEGRSKETLATSTAFAQIRSELTPASIGIVYADSTETQREMRRTFLPLLNTLADPELHGLLGAPPQFTAIVHRAQFSIETAILTTPLRQESVVKIDQGLKQFLRSEFDREPAAPPATPLRTLAMVPDQAIGYSITRNGSAENFWQEVRYLLEQQRLELRESARRFGDARELSERMKAQEAMIDRVLVPINDKLAPSLKGEMGIIAGGFSTFGFKGPDGMEIRNLQIPAFALLVHTPAADQALEGFQDLFAVILSIVDEADRNRPEATPIKLDKQDLDGIATWVFASPFLTVEGFEPHFARLGEALIFSTSFDLTKKMRDTSAGKLPTIATTPTHIAMKELLPVAADQASFVDGAAFSRNLRSMADGIFTFLEKNHELIGIKERDLEQIQLAKRSVGIGLVLTECLRASASSVVGEGRFDMLREWIHIEDLKAK